MEIAISPLFYASIVYIQTQQEQSGWLHIYDLGYNREG